MTETNTKKRFAIAPLLIGLALGATLAACARSAYESRDARPAQVPTMAEHTVEQAVERADEHKGHDMDTSSGRPAGDADRGKPMDGMDHDAPAPAAPTPAVPAVDVQIDLGNANCPTMGGAVNGKTFTVWQNLRVGHCCPGCDDTFLASPESLLDEVSPGWRKALAAVESINAATGAERDRLIAVHSGAFTIVPAAGSGR